MAPDKDTIGVRWAALLAGDRKLLFKEADRQVSGEYPDVHASGETLAPILSLSPSQSPLRIERYGFRSFDRQWVLADGRVGDRWRPQLLRCWGPKQVFLTSMLTGILGEGPAATVTGLVPDRHHFRGSFSGKDIVPLWRDKAGLAPNVTGGLLSKLGVSPEDLFAYCYALLSSPSYVDRFSEELTIPGPRIPITKDPELFSRVSDAGRELIWVHTYGERFVPAEKTRGQIPKGSARSTKPIPESGDGYPAEFSYDESTQTLSVGSGAFSPLSSAVWEFSVSGLKVLASWLAYRMRDGAGRTSSPLDEIRPEHWTIAMTSELLELLWLLEYTCEKAPDLQGLLDEVVASDLWTAADLPSPSAQERKPPQAVESSAVGLF